MTVRFFILQAQYRGTLDFSNDSLVAANKGYKKHHRVLESLVCQRLLLAQSASRTLDLSAFQKHEGKFGGLHSTAWYRQTQVSQTSREADEHSIHRAIDLKGNNPSITISRCLIFVSLACCVPWALSDANYSVSKTSVRRQAIGSAFPRNTKHTTFFTTMFLYYSSRFSV